MMGRTAFLRVGLLIVLGASGILGIVLFLGGDRWSAGHVYESYFNETVQGLDVGAPIKFRGVTLGRVSRIGLVSAEYGVDQAAALNARDNRQVFVRYTIDPSRVGRLPDTATAIKTGLRARIAAQGITGLSYVELDFVDPQKFPAQDVAWVPKGDVLPSMPSTLAQVQNAAQEFLAKLNNVDLDGLSQRIIGLLDDVRGSLESGDVHIAITEAIGLLRTVQANIDRADVPALVAEMRATTDAARNLVATVRGIVDQAQVPTLVQQMAATATKLQALITRLDGVARQVGEGTADMQQALVPLLRDTEAVMNNLRETTDTMRQYPAGTMLGGPPPRSAPAATPGKKP